MPDMLCYEVEDEAGDWLPVEDVNFVDLLPESFIRTMEACAMAAINPHNLDLLPMAAERSEEHTSELQSLMRISYAVFCLKKKTTNYKHTYNTTEHNQFIDNLINTQTLTT